MHQYLSYFLIYPVAILIKIVQTPRKFTPPLIFEKFPGSPQKCFPKIFSPPETKGRRRHDHPVNLMKSHNLIRILQAVLRHFPDTSGISQDGHIIKQTFSLCGHPKQGTDDYLVNPLLASALQSLIVGGLMNKGGWKFNQNR